VGSGKAAHLVLDDPYILPVHARLLLSTSGQVLLTNLGESGSIHLQDDAVESFTPVNWKPGTPLVIASYTLNLDVLETTGTAFQREHLRAAMVTQNNEQVAAPGEVIIYWGEDEQEATSSTVELSGEDVPSGAPPSRVDEPIEEASIPAPEDMVLPEFLDETDITGAEDSLPALPEQNLDWDSTEAMPDLPPAMVMSPDDYVSGTTGTLPKDWQIAGTLSAQMSLNPINMAAGEQVRVPVSVRNQGEQPAQVRLVIAGLSRQWVVMPHETLELAPGEMKSAEIILRILPDVTVSSFACVLRLYDRLREDELTLIIPFEIIIKPQPILTGWLNPPEAHYPKSPALRLQNHTLADADIFITGHSGDQDVFVMPEHPQVRFPPGQVLQIPVQIRVGQRPWLRPRRVPFSVSAAHSSRAPLDFPGVVVIPPRLGLKHILLTAGLVAILGVVLLAVVVQPGQEAGDTQQLPTLPPPTTAPTLPPSQPAALPAPQDSLTATMPPSSTPVIITATVLSQATGIPATPVPPDTITATALSQATGILPTPTATGVVTAIADDPRAPDCTLPIPPGWQPYTVRQGDRAFRLAVDHGTTVDEIAAVNCLANPRLLQVGDILLLPPK
jgi:LysM repeat protein